MKKILIYSSNTGNTKKVIENCHKVLNDFELTSVDNVKELSKYDIIIFGTWIDKGTADQKILNILPLISNKKVGYIATLGAYPDSEHAKKCLRNIDQLVIDNGNELLGNFICQGAIDPKLIEKMKTFPESHPHYPDEARLKRWEDAKSHPDQTDLENAQKSVLSWF